MAAIKNYSFSVSIVADELDGKDVVEVISEVLAEALPDFPVHVKQGAIKLYSEQGYKVFRARVLKITAKEAGDAHNGKVKDEGVVV